MLTSIAQPPIWPAIIRALQALPIAPNITVFGSIARGEARASSDVDCFIEGEPIGVMAITQQYAGMLDPFFMSNGMLWTRSADATRWTRASHARRLLEAIKRDGVPLLSVTLPPTEDQSP